MSPQTFRKEEKIADVSQAAVTVGQTSKRNYQAKRALVGSPRRRRINQPLTIRMSLTEGQMNKLTEAITQKVDRSPVKTEKISLSDSVNHSKDSCLSDSYVLPPMTYDKDQPRHRRVDDASASSEIMQRNKETEYKVTSLATRRNQIPPHPLQTPSPPRCPKFPPARRHTGLGLDCPPGNIFPEKQLSFHDRAESGRIKNDYRRSKQKDDIIYDESRAQRVNEAIIDMYSSWADNRTPEQPRYPRRQQSLLQRSRRSKSTVGNLTRPGISSPVSTQEFPLPAPPLIAPNDSSVASPSLQFSPLPLYFRGQSFPSIKRGEKTMIGHNGWLECTGETVDDRKKPPPKRMGFLDSIKKMAKDVTAELNPSHRRPNPSMSGVANHHVAISLNAREQSLLYCELEFYLTSSLNDYIVAEFEKGHLVPANLKKVSDFWLQQGRPRVITFRYDLETQLELIAMHLNEFSFYGRRQNNPSEILGLLHAMKVNARSIRVRTFCQPDSVIAKQLLDSQSLFNMLNTSNAQQLALAEIASFFKKTVDRELVIRETSGQGETDLSLNEQFENLSWE
ncbi:hypothetical protein QQS21_001132 [Conoideocrella luteorostrata]|uniref:Uncharacterized protein n=1 Tax=Conoideocrella luteorostrata TaxID=1105319 RepID=A0AAJ0FXU6_9HYPO|nr:hypothetical protein QQS21_001132 [Conoideocrella luteorostrata]